VALVIQRDETRRLKHPANSILAGMDKFLVMSAGLVVSRNVLRFIRNSIQLLELAPASFVERHKVEASSAHNRPQKPLLSSSSAPNFGVMVGRRIIPYNHVWKPRLVFSDQNEGDL